MQPAEQPHPILHDVWGMLEVAMKGLGLLLLRLTVGGLLAGHGAQKLFGAFDGPGFSGTAGFMEKLGLRPGHVWASMATSGEFGGGLLTALGLAGPLGPILAISAMVMAAVKGHWGKPIWATSGGAELPVVNIAALGALAMIGPGTLSLDRLFGVRLPGWLVALFTVGAVGTVAYGALTVPDEQGEEAGTEGDDRAAA
jgi:putative oxidoreductase